MDFLFAPLGFCSLCIRVHLWQTAAVRHSLPCHAGRSQMKAQQHAYNMVGLRRGPLAPHA